MVDEERLLMSENWRQSKICIVVNDKSEGTTAKHLSCDGLLHHKFIIQFAGESIFKIGEHSAKLQGCVISYKVVSYAPFTLDFCPQRCRTGHIGPK